MSAPPEADFSPERFPNPTADPGQRLGLLKMRNHISADTAAAKIIVQ
jgi:hypothetical protein